MVVGQQSSSASPDHDADEASESADMSSSAGSARRGRRRQDEQGVGSWLLELVLIAVIALVISALIRNFLLQMFLVPSGSMENTLQINDRVAVVEVTQIHRGDVVVFRDPGRWLGPGDQTSNPVRKVVEFLGVVPSASTDHLVKRVIGMPGDHVACCDISGRVTVNGVPLNERSYLYSVNGVSVNPSDQRFDVVVPAGSIFVMGDHRNASKDSRAHLCDDVSAGQVPGAAGFVPLSDVTGPGVAIAMPFSRIQRLTIPSTFANIPPPADPAPADPIVDVRPCG